MKTLLIDFNNIAMSKLYSKNVMDKDGYDVKNIDYNMWEFEIFSAIYSYYMTYSDADEIVLAVDHKKSWRKTYFKRYKEHRQKTKDKFNIDWDEYNKRFTDYVEEIKKSFPFKTIKIKFCEGDDIIGTIALNYPDNIFYIISSDEDCLQLCRDGIKIFSISKHQEVAHPNPEMFLQEKCLTGQSKDNIFNVITPLDYPNELRKPGFGTKKAEKFFIEGLDKALDETIEYNRKFVDNNGETVYYKSSIYLKDRYNFNRNLIDFKKIPEKIKSIIIKKYENYEYPDPENVSKFLLEKNWRFFIDNITNVENRIFQLYKSKNM